MSFGFEVAHGYEILKGYVDAKDKDDAIRKILKKDWNDILDEFETDNFTEGYEIVDLWESK